MMHFIELTSYLARTSAGSFTNRTNIVGTTWLMFARWRSISARYSSGSKCSITITVPPRACTDIENRNGAAWYSGAGDR